MPATSDFHRPLGNSGLLVPPIIFSAAPLANACRVIPDQTKLALCGEWLKLVAAPVFVDVPENCGDGQVLDRLSMFLRRLDVTADEVVLNYQLRSDNPESLLARWDKSCHQLGAKYGPQTASLDLRGQSNFATTFADHDDCTYWVEQIQEACQSLAELKASGRAKAIGVASNQLKILQPVVEQFPLDWVTVTGGLSLIRHPAEVLSFIDDLRRRQISVVITAPFEGGFLVGGNSLSDRLVDRDKDADRALFAWRTSVAALCEAHGVTPAHASLQFVLSVPGVTAVLMNSSRPDRVAENVRFVVKPVPSSLWASMREEGLIELDFPHIQ